MKRSCCLHFILILLIAGCSHPYLRHRQNIEKITVGQDETYAKMVMGVPDVTLPLQEGKTLYLYHMEPENSWEGLTVDNCTLILVQAGKVISVGEDFNKNWQIRVAANTPQPEAINAEAPSTEASESGTIPDGQLDEPRIQRIKALEEEVRPVPASNYALNLKLYRELHQLDPENSRYREKVAFYQSKVDKQKAGADTLEADEGTTSIGFKTDRQEAHQTERPEVRVGASNLQLYKGNDRVELALSKLSGGRLYVWVKNISPDAIVLEAGNYQLFDRNKNRIDCESGSGLQKELPAGQIAHGQIKYGETKDVQLGEIVFDHPSAGKIIRMLP